MRLVSWVEQCGRNVKFALRQLRRAPGFTLTVVLTLAFGSAPRRIAAARR